MFGREPRGRGGFLEITLTLLWGSALGVENSYSVQVDINSDEVRGLSQNHFLKIGLRGLFQ